MDQHWLCNFPQELIQEIKQEVINIEDGIVNKQSNSGLIKRNSQISWIKNKDLCHKVFGHIANQVSFYNNQIHLNNIEPIQYSEYSTKQEYGWHRDVHPTPYPDGRIRKISFSVFLNDDYEGGEFDLELFGPAANKRYETINKKRNANCLIFHSDMWHRVRPVTKGVKKSLVGWILGPKFR